ncbi:MAG: hypothetical protein JO283_22465 [Bradyrhizobium sp.]|nr:hypothetical protein [Bradyrhizobium sp.]
MNDSNPGPLFEAAASALSEIGIAFLDVREPGYDGTFAGQTTRRSHRGSARLSPGHLC